MHTLQLIQPLIDIPGSGGGKDPQSEGGQVDQSENWAIIQHFHGYGASQLQIISDKANFSFVGFSSEVFGTAEKHQILCFARGITREARDAPIIETISVPEECYLFPWMKTKEQHFVDSDEIQNQSRILSAFDGCKLLEKGLSAIFGPQSEIPSMHVQSICDDLEVLHVQSRWEHLLNRDKLSINLYPNPSVINEAFVRILNLWNWRDFVIVYEEDDGEY
ncbi:putative glutamate receptor [Trichonephila clavipes]|nr:putative glutamate receptor [Trichonephila clavipes]